MLYFSMAQSSKFQQNHCYVIIRGITKYQIVSLHSSNGILKSIYLNGGSFYIFTISWLLSWWNNITLQYAKWSFSIMQMSYFVSQPFHSPTNFSWVPTGRTKGFKHIVRRPRPSIHFLFRGKPYRVGMMIFNDNVSLEEKCCLYLRVFYVCKIR